MILRNISDAGVNIYEDLWEDTPRRSLDFQSYSRVPRQYT